MFSLGCRRSAKNLFFDAGWKLICSVTLIIANYVKWLKLSETFITIIYPCTSCIRILIYSNQISIYPNIFFDLLKNRFPRVECRTAFQPYLYLQKN